MPDHPLVLQSFLWQDYDLAPKFPILMKFLAFWQEKLDGRSTASASATQL